MDGGHRSRKGVECCETLRAVLKGTARRTARIQEDDPVLGEEGRCECGIDWAGGCHAGGRCWMSRAPARVMHPSAVKRHEHISALAALEYDINVMFVLYMLPCEGLPFGRGPWAAASG